MLMEKNGGATSKFAIIGLVLGIISFFNVLGIEKGVAAIVFSVLGLMEIKKSENTIKGKGMAVTGIVLGAVMIVLAVIFVANMDYFRNLQTR